MPAVSQGLPLLPGRHALPDTGGWRSAARCGLLPGSVHGAGPGQHGGGLPLQEEQGEGGRTGCDMWEVALKTFENEFKLSTESEEITVLTP